MQGGKKHEFYDTELRFLLTDDGLTSATASDTPRKEVAGGK
jgi:hypothetical protein